MSEPPRDEVDPEDVSPLTALMAGAGVPFTTAFRGYDKSEVDAALADLTARQASQSEAFARREGLQRAAEAARAAAEAEAERLRAELAVMTAKASNAEQQVQTLTEELVAGEEASAAHPRFEEVLHVAEEQAAVLIKNATTQAHRLLEAATEDIQHRRADAQAEADAILARAQHDAQQARVRIETERTAHEAELERSAAHSAEKVGQAEQEAAAIRSEAEKGAAALRALVARETSQARAEADEAVREQRLRALEFEQALTRRQDDAQQEFLMLHNQAVAHAERITSDANDQVAAALEHAQRITAKADDFDRLMRAQAQQIEADANLRARELLDRARVKAQSIIDSVTGHSQAVLRDAEDRARALRWQQQQLTGFMAEVRELMRPEVVDAEPSSFEEPDSDDSGSPDSDVREEPAAQSAGREG